MSVMTGAGTAGSGGLVYRSLPLSAVALAGQLHTLGEVRVRTTAGAAFIEQVGSFPHSDDVTEAGLVIGEDGLDLRLNLRAWFWVGMTHDAHSQQYGLRVFDRQGSELLRLTSPSHAQPIGWARLYAQGVANRPTFEERSSVEPREVQAPGLLKDWAGMNNVHDHFALLKRHGLSRYEGNRVVAPQFSRQQSMSSPVALFEQLATSGLELMLFVYSLGSVQIFTGRLTGLQRSDATLTFDMPATDLAAPTRFSVKEAPGAEIWRVHKPNEQGGVTSLEVFDAEQRLIVQVFARRPAGEPEQPAWREWLDALEAH